MKKIRSVFLFTLILLLAACNLPQAGMVLPTETVVEITEEPTPALPTEEPTPEPIQEKVVFIPDDASPSVTAVLRSALPAFCEGKYEYEESADIPADADFVFFAQKPADLSAFTAQHPESHVVIFGNREEVYDGIWTVQYDPSTLPFLAGLAVAGNSYDWRSLGLLPSDSAVYGEHYEEAFLNGAHYLCGDCRAVLSPYVNYPLTVSLPSGTSAESWNAQIDEAAKSFVYGVFVSEEAALQEVFQKLLTMNVKLVGFFMPPAGLENNWAATINYNWNDLFSRIIERSLSGETGGLIAPNLAIIPGALSEDFSTGKTEMLEQAYQDLLSGFLSPFDPTAEYN